MSNISTAKEYVQARTNQD